MTPETILNRLRQADDWTLIRLAADIANYGGGYLRIDNTGIVTHVAFQAVSIDTSLARAAEALKRPHP